MHHLATSKDLQPLLDDIGDASIVMLGEASHGTHEYYTWRTGISKELIRGKDFQFIAVEGDWPDCYKINRYVKGYPSLMRDVSTAPDTITGILKNFSRWPTWMWANWEVAALAEWLKENNMILSAEKKSGFYGLDVYSLWDSMHEIVHYLEKEDAKAADMVKQAIRCFEPYREDAHRYARASLTKHSCRDKVLALLKEVRLKSQFLDGDREAGLNAEQNALVSVNAERYYHSMMKFDNESWNVRDTHMMETLHRLMEFTGDNAKGIVWEHNTHIGDTRATDMKREGMINIGQLAREQYGTGKVYLVGFGCYRGSVIAGEAWDAPMEEMEVPPARQDSVEHKLHNEFGNDVYLLFSDREDRRLLEKAMPHRAIGVVYNPGREQYGNYVTSIMPQRYNAFIFIDETTALHPLHIFPHSSEIPAAYPFGE